MKNIDNTTLDLIMYLYGCMFDADKAAWSLAAAKDMVEDQRRYEIERGITPGEYDAQDFYDVIAELIAQEEDVDYLFEDDCYEESDEYIADRGGFRSASGGDYSPATPWDAPGMSVRDFI